MDKKDRDMDREWFLSGEDVPEAAADFAAEDDDLISAEENSGKQEHNYPAAKKKKKTKAQTKGKSQKKKMKKKGKKKGKRKTFTKVFVVILVLLIIIFGWIGYVGAYVYPLLFGDLEEESTSEPITEEQKNAFASGQLCVALLGSDRREGDEVSRSDTLMVAFVDFDQKSIRLLSIPRDTYVTIPTSGERTKVNHAYAYGGVDLTKQTLASNFGINCDYYMDVDFQGFIDIIDAIGGLTINVPMDMYYLAEGIDLKAGVQELDGNKSLQFCRFRSDGQGDLGRIERQQAFLVALKDSMFSAGTFLRIPELCTAVMDNLQTDFTGTQILQMAMRFRNGVNLETYEPDNNPAYKNDISYVFITEKGQRLIDALVAFGEIPSDIEATTGNIDLSAEAATAASATSGEATAPAEGTTEE